MVPCKAEQHQEWIPAKQLLSRNWVVSSDRRGALSSYREAQLMSTACQAPVSPVLLVCRESRNLAMETYKRTFACPNSIPETYFNFVTDILYINYDRSCRMCLDVWNGFRKQDTKDLKKVERLAIRGCTWSFYKEDIKKVLSIFPRNRRSSRPVHVQETIKSFQTFDVQREFAKNCIKVPSPCRNWKYNLSTENLERLKKSKLEIGEPWTLPEIERKTMAPYKTKLALQEAEDNCRARIDTFMSEMERQAREMWANPDENLAKWDDDHETWLRQDEGRFGSDVWSQQNS
ncbi:uncharacterized protein PAC_00383 [Phialocephala subalpina]|uniref:2EXR domain-containing protein n=1 Tax=Phialocephala subalpina TaxID=576137 RepID=A0A1L7WCK8_9HELO|nr:uncharacterized protein PAC_00383 [Phialocephala subalpina]